MVIYRYIYIDLLGRLITFSGEFVGEGALCFFVDLHMAQWNTCNVKLY